MISARAVRTATTWMPRVSAAYAAAGWSALFCLQSLVAVLLAMVGTDFGADTFAANFARLARERDIGFIAVLWLAVLAKGAGAVLALAWVRALGGRIPPRLLLALTWTAGVALLGYGLIDLVESLLMRSGHWAVPASLGERALDWHLKLWTPYWILGGLLFLIIPRRDEPGHEQSRR